MLVEMSMVLVPSKEEFVIGRKRGEYIVSPGARERLEEMRAAAKRDSLMPSIAEEVVADDSDDDAEAAAVLLLPSMSKEEEVEEARKLMSAVKALGEVMTESLGVVASDGGDESKSQQQRDNDVQTMTAGVRVPFPKELVQKLEELERMMREAGADPKEIRSISEKVALAKELTGGGMDRQ
jgi:alkanesulfonate monooxygenase SsuD/methylene tetrahydromethanopterin reductase-like flavin-dependent oxidoreductase (luciferase family)